MQTRQKDIDLCYLCERPWPALDTKLRVAELTVAGVGRRQPLLQAALVHRPQGAGAVTGGQEALTVASFMANTTYGAVAVTKNKKTILTLLLNQIQLQH